VSKLIIIADGEAVQPRKVTCVRRSTIDPNKTVIFTSGQAHDDGFLVDIEFEDAVTQINAELPDDDD
jgi:hypothetical protein